MLLSIPLLLRPAAARLFRWKVGHSMLWTIRTWCVQTVLSVIALVGFLGVPPVAEDELTDRQKESLLDPMRAKSAYFRLLAHDPDVLEAHTLTDKDIFCNTTDGLGRAERELSAAVNSRFNGCVYCASVHNGRALKESPTDQESQAENAIARLCDEGISADLGSPLWNALSQASVALSTTPIQFNIGHVNRLREAGLDDGAIVDVINATVFFNWANRSFPAVTSRQIVRAYLSLRVDCAGYVHSSKPRVPTQHCNSSGLD